MGFTAGGSGRVSSAAIIKNAPSTQIMHEINFIFICATEFHRNAYSLRMSGNRTGLDKPAARTRIGMTVRNQDYANAWRM